MSKRNKITYWVATLWLALGMASTGVVQVLHVKNDVDFILKLGYPEYILTLLGVWKILGVVAVLIPKYPLVKEWAYAGFFFTMTGALYSHIVMGNPFGDIAPPILLLVLTAVSWYFRPAERKLVAVA
jgi:hypothetical protein